MVRDPAIPPLVSVTEAAAMLECNRAWVNRLVNDGKLPAAWAGSTLVLAKATVQAYQRGERFSYPATLEISYYDGDQWVFDHRRVVGPDFQAPESFTLADIGGDPDVAYRVEVLDTAGRTVGLIPVEGEAKP